MSSADKPKEQASIAAFVGIDWADQKHDIALRAASSQDQPERCRIESQPEALNDWVLQMRERFGSQGKILICLEQSRGALIHFLMGDECFELYPINPNSSTITGRLSGPVEPKTIPWMRNCFVNLSVCIMTNCGLGGPTTSKRAN